MAFVQNPVTLHPSDLITCFVLHPLENPDSHTYILYLCFDGSLKGGITSPRFIRTDHFVEHELLTTKSMSVSDFNQILKGVLRDVCSGHVDVLDRHRVIIERLISFDPDTVPPAKSSKLPVHREESELYVLRRIVNKALQEPPPNNCSVM